MKKSYKDLKRSLDNVIENLQNPDIDLDEALKLHEKGKQLLTELQQYLAEVEEKVTKAFDK